MLKTDQKIKKGSILSIIPDLRQCQSLVHNVNIGLLLSSLSKTQDTEEDGKLIGKLEKKEEKLYENVG